MAARACRSPSAAAAVRAGGGEAARAALWALVAMDGQCPDGSAPDVPHTAFENLLLQQAAAGTDVARALLPLSPPAWRPAWMT